ncbi:MAG: hypothetical protein GVY33_09595 [Alphaproteobacteria bacterium]|jgi:pimeloyl-ACP methyl ester carboxylesterase|nr:hypothetical protein [Alphaproteobacteria bacterium]
MRAADTASAAAAAGFRLVRRPGCGRREPAAWLALPPAPAAGAVPLVAVHGILRAAEDQARAFAERAARRGRPVVAPLFDETAFPGYQRAVGRDRADLALLGLLDALAHEGVCEPGRIELFGYSGGGQFAHRFAWLYPHRVDRLTVAAAGWYTFPDTAPFPYGLGAGSGKRDFARHFTANLRDVLALPITVAVGADDDVVDENTRRGPAIDAQQGRTRLHRAQRWRQAMEDRARAFGLEPRVALHLLADCGHDFRQCVAVGGLDRLVLPLAGEEAGMTPPAVRSSPGLAPSPRGEP